MDDGVTLRPARKSDAADLAILDNLAGHGISLWFWQQDMGGAPIDQALAHGRNRFLDENADFAWKNTVVAMDQSDCISGALNSYVMQAGDDELDEIKSKAPVFAPVFELFNLTIGNWLIDSLAVYPSSQGRGIGRRLLKDSLGRARGQGLSTSSLVVEDSNHAARALYQSFGYEVVANRPYLEFEYPSQTNEWLLMSAKI